jgi:cell division cycle 20-like protein 1, cofactor of APC complex
VHQKLVRTLEGHLGRVSSISWNDSLVSTGSRDRNILCRDLRDNNNHFRRFQSHKQEVCGLKWSFDNQQLASGGNDNKLMIWNLHSEKPLVKFSDHTAAVKAIGWSPHQNGLLATGGGTADRHIRFWNTHTLQPLHAVDTGSQVCNLVFSKTSHEIVSTHGYSLN